MSAAVAAAAEEIVSHDPATGKVVGRVALSSPEDVRRAVEESARVQPLWAQLRPVDRSRYLLRAAQAIIDDLEELRDLIVREQGKPRTEALTMELLPTVDALHWIADEGPRVLADERLRIPQVFLKSKRAWVAWEPLGVVGVIAPWNYPWTIPLGEVAMALMAGNGVVLKPAPLTCLLGERIGELFARAGLPDGLLQVVHGDAEAGQALVESPVSKVFFTGSVPVGRKVGERCAADLKGSVLELGGKDPMLVLEDAPLDHAVRGALWGGFANAGQTCSGIERVYVRREVFGPFVERLVAGARALRVGDPTDWSTEVGPMTSREQFDKVRELVDDAVAAGARLECGGPVEPAGLSGCFYAPAVLTGVTHDMRVMREEAFGPVLPVLEVATDVEAVRLANDSPYGLGASVWTRDRQRGDRIGRALQAGMVWINDHMYSHGACQMPWGGVKESGLGRAHSRLAFEECANPKLMTWEPSRVRALWWHPYDETLGRALQGATAALYGREDDRPRALRAAAVPLARVLGRLARDAARR